MLCRGLITATGHTKETLTLLQGQVLLLLLPHLPVALACA